jgi:bifunctional enzyme CysN/CysC
MGPMIGIAKSGPVVVWVTGYSASGKTSVGRKTESLLRAQGHTTVFLDGDDLRSILGNRWGYDREERIDLSRVYFRLCNHLASQGVIVVIAAVAMYKEIREWTGRNVPGLVEVYLDVPEDERVQRDRATKNIYEELKKNLDQYDPPPFPDLRIFNYAHVTVDDAAARIVDYVSLQQGREEVDHGRQHHWAEFYSGVEIPKEPSSFALEVSHHLPKKCRLLEVGCGNGRDASYFASVGHAVTALDTSATAIESCKASYKNGDLKFIAGSILNITEGTLFDAIYSRFCLHAMTPPEEDQFIKRSKELLTPTGRLFIECRSINDPLARKGEVISPTERIFGHYRRFIIAEELVRKLKNIGLHLISLVEAGGVSKLGDDDPVVVRAIASIVQEPV